jgi:hypothetical protein
VQLIKTIGCRNPDRPVSAEDWRGTADFKPSG